MCDEPSAFQGGGAPVELSSSWEDGGHVWPSPAQPVDPGLFDDMTGDVRSTREAVHLVF